MNKIAVFLIIIFVFACAPKQTVFNAKPSEMEWLLGVWKEKNKDLYEKWVKVTDTEYRGVGYDMIQGWPNITENLRLFKEGKTWYYEAKVKANNHVPVLFTQIPDPVYTFKFVNEKHDFPQVIFYKKEAFDVMTTCISDLAGTKQECMEFMRYTAQ